MLDTKQIKTLQQCKLFAGFSETEILQFFDDINYKLVAFSKNEIYSLAGMPYRHVDIVLAGTMVCRMTSVGGKQIEVSRLRAGHLIAPAFIFSANNLMPVSVETVEPCSIVRIDKVDFARAIDENSRLCMNFIRNQRAFADDGQGEGRLSADQEGKRAELPRHPSLSQPPADR